MVEKKTINRVIVLTAITILLIASIFLIYPILISILAGAFFAYILHPLYKIVKKRINNDNLATFTFCLLLLVIILGPIIFLLPKFAKEIFDTFLYLQKLDISNAIGQILNLFFSDDIARAAAVQTNLAVTKIFSFTLESMTRLFSNLPNIVLQFVIFLFTFYFATRDSEKIRAYLSELSPLSANTEQKFATEFRNVTNSIVFGQIITGLVQGLALGLGLWILGVKQVFFLTVIAIIASIIPLVGAWLIWVPVSLFMIVSGNTLNGFILFFYGMFFVSVIDNFLRPYLISRRSNLGLFAATIGTIGGLYTFGLIGLILGPLILSYMIIFVEFYKQGKLNELIKE